MPRDRLLQQVAAGSKVLQCVECVTGVHVCGVTGVHVCACGTQYNTESCKVWQSIAECCRVLQ